MSNKKQNTYEELDQTPITYVVVRDGNRVSDREYNNESEANEEFAFWNRIVTSYPDGTKVKIVPFDKKKHRIW